MNKKKITLLSVAAAVLMAGILMSSVWLAYFSGGGASFELPPLLPPGTLPGDTLPGMLLDGQSLTPLTVGPRNIQALLASVEYPASYRQTVDCVTYWEGEEQTVTHSLTRRGGLVRMETFRGIQPVQNHLITSHTTYAWTGDSPVVHELGSDADALAGIPAWEKIISMPLESILHAEYIYLPGERALRIKTLEPVYQGEYLVSLETGLIIKAAFTDADERLAYEVRSKGQSVIGDPGDGWFTLPDGRTPS